MFFCGFLQHFKSADEILKFLKHFSEQLARYIKYDVEMSGWWTWKKCATLIILETSSNSCDVVRLTLCQDDREKNIRKKHTRGDFTMFLKITQKWWPRFHHHQCEEEKSFSVDNLAILFRCLTMLTINDNDQLLAFMTPFHCCRHLTWMNEILKTPHNVVVNFRQIQTRDSWMKINGDF